MHPRFVASYQSFFLLLGRTRPEQKVLLLGWKRNMWAEEQVRKVDAENFAEKKGKKKNKEIHDEQNLSNL